MADVLTEYATGSLMGNRSLISWSERVRDNRYQFKMASVNRLGLMPFNVSDQQKRTSDFLAAVQVANRTNSGTSYGG